MNNYKIYVAWITVILFITGYSTNAQNDPSAKVLMSKLPGTWMLKTLYKPDYDSMDEEDWYYPIDDKNINKFVWNETAWEDSRYPRDFGITTIEFLSDGSFRGEHHKGKKLVGEWKYAAPKRKRGAYFYMSYNGNMEESNPWSKEGETYDYSLTFHQVEFNENELILTGDTCNDGCLLKAVFERVN